ncbi:ParB N-terminal domain-containing protein [Yokenella regensburgei]|uniref:IbrB-like domain-containing protein n=1 Tax=Yokenella regensburgei TaxID=158877 RepID=UPI0027F6F9AD|nr:ParB N-terminal domain-containing protein [Yokenella regensburgei]
MMIDTILDTISNYINNLNDEDKIKRLNDIKLCLHNISPFRHDPVDCVLWISVSELSANDYNPNVMAPQEKKLLKHSVNTDGFTQPVVVFSDGSGYHIVDGFHRSGLCRKRNARFISGYVPVTLLGCSSSDKCRHMASTIRHNRARGLHNITPMSDIIRQLHYLGWNDEKISLELGMDRDEVLRLRQISGITEVFSDQEYSNGWTVR